MVTNPKTEATAQAGVREAPEWYAEAWCRVAGAAIDVLDDISGIDVPAFDSENETLAWAMKRAEDGATKARSLYPPPLPSQSSGPTAPAQTTEAVGISDAMVDDAWAAFLKECERIEQCPDCHGAGRHPDESDCSTCNNAGCIEPPDYNPMRSALEAAFAIVHPETASRESFDEAEFNSVISALVHPAPPSTGAEPVAWRVRPQGSSRPWTLYDDPALVEFYRSRTGEDGGPYDIEPLYAAPQPPANPEASEEPTNAQ